MLDDIACLRVVLSRAVDASGAANDSEMDDEVEVETGESLERLNGTHVRTRVCDVRRRSSRSTGEGCAAHV